MTLAELNIALKATGYPVAYSHFKQAINPPFITYLFAYSSDLQADNVNYHKISSFQVELYTDKKDLAAESKVQKVFKDNELPYQKSETWIKDEGLFQILYEIQLIGE